MFVIPLYEKQKITRYHYMKNHYMKRYHYMKNQITKEYIQFLVTVVMFKCSDYFGLPLFFFALFLYFPKFLQETCMN